MQAEVPDTQYIYIDVGSKLFVQVNKLSFLMLIKLIKYISSLSCFLTYFSTVYTRRGAEVSREEDQTNDNQIRENDR